jgi:hypothetical protein
MTVRRGRPAPGAAAVLLLAAAARGDVFNYLSAPVDVTPGTTSAWTDVDASSNVPAGATGVIVQMLNTSGATTYHYGVRNNGSSDTFMLGAQKTAIAGGASFFMVGCDGSRIFEVYMENAAVKTYLLGYTTAGVTFFTNATDKSTGTTGSYVDIDISGDTGASTAIGAVFIVKNTSSTARSMQLRKNGSGDNRYTNLMSGWATAGIIGVDGSEICEQKISNTAVDMYLVGYVTTGAVFFTNAVNKSTGTTGSYVDTDITSDIGTDDATGAILEFDGGSGYLAAVRNNGAAYDHYGYIEHGYGVCAIDNGDVFEQKIANSNMDLFLVGYTTHTGTFYRSVGTAAGTLYSTGDCTVPYGGSTVTFAGGASLPSNVGQGDKLTIGSNDYYILSRDSATQVTIQELSRAAASGSAYTIARAYNDFSSWESGRQGNLVTGERTEVAVAYDDGDFTSAFTINGFTTDATHYIQILPASGHGHSGVAGAGVVIDVNDSGTAITISDDYVRIEGLQITDFAGANGRAGVRVNNGNNALLDRLIFYDFDTDHTARGVRNSTATGTIVRNCIIYGGQGYGIHADTGSVSMTVQNCTVHGMTGTGIQQGAGTLTVTNSISAGSSTADFAGTITQSYNISSDATASGAGSLTGRYAGNQFTTITAGAEDLHLKSGADAINMGNDLSGTFTNDVDGGTRPAGAAWDIGADERANGSTETNYRSVGTNAGTIYSTGNVTIAAGSTTATFAGGASLPANVGSGDRLTVGSAVFHLYARVSATEATVQVAASAAISNQAYAITRAYNDFQAWETARQGDLVSDDRNEVAVAYDDGDFTSGVTIDGSTTDSTRGIGITVHSTQAHAGLAGAGAVIDMNDTGTAVTVADDFTTVEGLQITRTGGAAGRSGVYVNADNARLRGLIVYGFDTGFSCTGIRFGSPSSGSMWNCIVYDGEGWGIHADTGTSALTIMNCTVRDVEGYGIRRTAGAVQTGNVIAMDCTTADFSGTITQTCSISSDASASGAGSLTGRSSADQFVSLTGGAEDFHLKAGADALNAGTDLSLYFSTDIDLDTRPVGPAWDIGADERVASSTNYRSVGTNAGTLYSTGVASISSGTSTVTFGGGASLPASVGAGDKITIGATEYYLLSRDSATQATVQETASSSLNNQAYTIVRAYNDFQSWETAVQGDLVADMRTEVAVAYDDGDFTVAVTIDGSTADATHYLEITVASGQRHAGQAGAGAVLDLGDTATAITVNDDYTRIGWLQVRRTGGASTRAAVDVSNASNVLLDTLLVHDFNGAANCYGLHAGANGDATVRNCIVYDGEGRGIYGSTGSTTLTVENCTVYGITGRGIARTAATMTATNSIAMGCTVEDFGTGITQSYNMSSDASASGTGSLPSRTASDQFVYALAGNINLHLKAGAEAIDAGSDLSASFTADCDNGTRAAPWDMGADEAGASGAGRKQTPRVATWQEAAP